MGHQRRLTPGPRRAAAAGVRKCRTLIRRLVSLRRPAMEGLTSSVMPRNAGQWHGPAHIPRAISATAVSGWQRCLRRCSRLRRRRALSPCRTMVPRGQVSPPACTRLLDRLGRCVRRRSVPVLASRPLGQGSCRERFRPARSGFGMQGKARSASPRSPPLRSGTGFPTACSAPSLGSRRVGRCRSPVIGSLGPGR